MLQVPCPDLTVTSSGRAAAYDLDRSRHVDHLQPLPTWSLTKLTEGLWPRERAGDAAASVRRSQRGQAAPARRGVSRTPNGPNALVRGTDGDRAFPMFVGLTKRTIGGLTESPGLPRRLTVHVEFSREQLEFGRPGGQGG
jgi:hypothetical protein